MVHGDCSSRGCYAMTDEQIQEIYALARESFFGGQKAFQLQAFPFRMTPLNMAKHRNNPNFAFWKTLKEGYDHFNATRREPKVAVCDRHYVFDAAAADGSTGRSRLTPMALARPISSIRRSPTRCSITGGKSRTKWRNTSPAELPRFRPAPASMAAWIPYSWRSFRLRPDLTTTDVAIRWRVSGPVPCRVSRMRLARFRAIPRHRLLPRRPGQDRSCGKAQPADCSGKRADAADGAAGLSKGEAPAPEQKPTTIAGLIGSWFSGSKTETPASPEKDQAAARSASTDTKSKRAAPVRTTTSAPVQSAQAAPTPKQREASPKPAEPAVRPATPALAPAVQTAKAEPPPQPEIRTAYTTPPASSNGLLTGAQPVVPVGTFNSFR